MKEINFPILKEKELIKDKEDFICNKESSEKDIVTEKFLIDKGILLKKGDIYEINFDLLKSRIQKSRDNSEGGGAGGKISFNGDIININHSDILNFFYKIKGYDANSDSAEIKPILSMPKTFLDAKSDNFSDGLVLPWEIFDKQIFHTQFELEDKNIVNLADLFYLKKIKELKFRKNEKGDLEYFDKIQNKYAKFSFQESQEAFGRVISLRDNDAKYSFESRPELFLKKFLPVVDGLGLFEDSSKRWSGYQQSEAMFSHERKLDKNNVYINISSDDVGFVSYYIGRNKIVGTDKEKNDALSAVELDKETVGVKENKYGKNRILYTFKKIDKKEFSDFGFDSMNAAMRKVNGNEMKERIKEYNVSDYVTQRTDESSKDYADKLSKLNDVDFVTKGFRSLVASKNIKLKQFSWSEQILIANYILEIKNKQEFSQFIEKYQENGLRCFLVAEADIAMAEKIVKMGNNLSYNQEVVKSLFSKYSNFSKEIVSSIDSLDNLYKNTFFDKNIDNEKLKNILLSRANQLLISASDKIDGLSPSEGEKEIESLINDLERETVNKLKNIDELKAIADNLNSVYPELLKSSNYEEETGKKIKTEYDQHKKFSSERIKEIIDLYQQLSKTEDEDSSEKNKHEEVIAKLKKTLPLQISLENKLDQVVYGYDLAKLPKDFNNFENKENLSEKIPEKAPLFFPVGISKDLPSWEKVLAGEKQFAKPIDMYGYMFWLNNQNREISLIVCDEIQINNYQLRYNRPKDEAKSLAIKIGNKEAENYQKIIDTFALDNIKVIRYNNFINSNKEKFDHYEKIVDQLQNHPIFREMFLAMVQESVSGAEKSEYLGYANEELSWILSTNGTKIGHLNEARYDILAALIKNVESASEKTGIDAFSNLDSQQVLSIIQAVSKNLKDIINEEKSKLDKKSSPFLYFQRLQDHLNKINIDRKIEANKEVKKSDMILNFSCPDVGSASFGWRGADEKKESTIKFKEPYSTYFYESHQDLLIDSDQVVALGDGYISGKIMTLENSRQTEYAEKVIKPMLKHYLAVLGKAPSDYFDKIGKDKNEILEELQKNQSLLDTLKFIQKYIIKPTE